MKVRVAASSAKSGIELLCGFVFSDGKLSSPVFPADNFDDDVYDAVSQSAKDMAGKRGRMTIIPVPAKKPARRILLAGLGRREELTLDTVRHVSGKIAKKAKELKLGEFAIVMPPQTEFLYSNLASAAAEGSVMSMYRFDQFKNESDDDDDDDDYDNDTTGNNRSVKNRSSKDAKKSKNLPHDKSSADVIISDILSSSKTTEFSEYVLQQPEPPSLVIVISDDPDKKSETIDAISDAVNVSVVTSYGNLFVRGVANLPPNVCNPKMLADIARNLARKNKLRCTILSKRDLKRRGFGGITAVGQGSTNEPYLIILEHAGLSKKGKARASSNARATTASGDNGPIVLVGKAVTFDTGGISIKPGASMDEMKFDKCGGCTVLGLMKTVSDLKLNSRIIGIIPAVENMPGGESFRPGDIIKLYSGKTAEILNTDAEGRLILADALSYGEQQYRPREMIDFATLTGACIVALGTNVAGMVSNNSELAGKLRRSSVQTAEPVWELPLDSDYMDMIKSSVADMKNLGIGRAAGTIVAAAFLKNAIVNDTPWAHLDIAGVAWTQSATKERSYKSKGATGFGLRLVVDHLLEMERK